jgi:CRP/FNR family transcriptional regulator, anaerobic regulatory protein
MPNFKIDFHGIIDPFYFQIFKKSKFKENGNILTVAFLRCIIISVRTMRKEVLAMNIKQSCRCDDCSHNYCASKVPIFSSLKTEQLQVLTDYITQKTFQKNENILIEGSPIENLIFINRGQAKAYKISMDGRENILYLFSEGDFFGEKNFLSQQKSTYSVTALSPTEVCMIHRKDFQQVVRKYPDIALEIIDALSQRIDRLEKSLDRGNRQVESRIHEVLLEFSQKYGEAHAKGLMVKLPVNREGLANYIGVARETVSRKMTLLENEGAIQMIGNNKVLILDQNLLAEQKN